MAQLNATESVARKKNGRHSRKANPIVDMTPMVDLGFLLICFFVFTTSMSQPAVTTLYLPKGEPTTLVPESTTLTVLADDLNKLFCYDGDWSNAVKHDGIVSTNYSVNDGLGSVIRRKQQLLYAAKGIEGKNKLMLIIKASNTSCYKNLIDVLDEVMINDVKHYAVVDLSADEEKFLQKN